LRTIRSN